LDRRIRITTEEFDAFLKKMDKKDRRLKKEVHHEQLVKKVNKK